MKLFQFVPGKFSLRRFLESVNRNKERSRKSRDIMPGFFLLNKPSLDSFNPPRLSGIKYVPIYLKRGFRG